jgi:hypothetical protein
MLVGEGVSAAGEGWEKPAIAVAIMIKEKIIRGI